MKKATRSRKERLTGCLYAMSHPLRYRIVKLLERGGPIYISKIADGLGMRDKSKLVAFHLSVLAEHGLVESRYGLRRGQPKDEKGRPIIVSYYKLTKKAKEAIGTFNL